ncbi:MFS transporter [Solemya velesiana gill symbiont]|uniref:MFS transporter n=1 Tax=Solemya velesiana gill symbiont TaxID=1918948 RepID=A0A1T2KV91_9GAMM|nr:MFS transporter [Solemya velesiana gill symbiont]OOZ36646.1 MFS transporter [Solemya velesiana gill symbiont]
MNSEKEQKQSGMSPVESRAAFSLAGIFSLRMLGLFMILPVFALYAEELQGVTPVLIGVAIGAYGLTQALLQIPFGMLSDRIGRKPVIIGGLLIFALGSVVAAMADTIWGVILGRALQGSGAIAAAVMSLAADLTREQNRTRVMAVIGLSIGMAFAVSLVLGPMLNAVIGVPGIFWLTAVLAVFGIGIVLNLVPDPRESHFHRDTEPVPAMFGKVLRNANLVRLDIGIFTLHMILTATFIAIPLALRDFAGLEGANHWMVYLPVLLLAMGLMIPFVVIAEKRRKMKGVFLGAVFAIALAQFGFMWLHQSIVGIGFALLVYFTAFNVLEATLPSLIAKVAPAESKGTAMGVYSTSQFIGAFLGGLIGGLVYAEYGLQGVFLFGAITTLFWLAVASGMQKPSYFMSYLIKVGRMDDAQAWELQAQLREIEGVGDAAVVGEEGVAYLKVDSQVVNYEALEKFSVEEKVVD